MLEKYASQATFIAILLSGLLFYLGGKLAIPLVTNLGVACFGIFFLIQGAQIMITRRASFLWSQGRKASMAAQLWGGIFIGIAGLILLAAGANLFLPGGSSGYMDRMLSRPFGWGLLLGVGGVFATVYGAVELLTGGQQSGPGIGVFLANLRDWLIGTFIVAAGLLLTLVGLGLILAPGLMSTLGAALLQAFEKLVQ